MIHQLVAILLLCGLLGLIGCGLEKLTKVRMWKRRNQRQAYERYPRRWRMGGSDAAR